MERLRCEYLERPAGIEEAAPRLSWIVRSDRRGQRQTAFRLLAASSPALLAADAGDLWDSGKVAGDETLHVPYAGKALQSGQRCFWKVRAWDRDDRPSAWSAASEWTMGLLDASDWRAKWITTPEDDASSPDFAGAGWIWHDEPSWKDPESGLSAPDAPGGRVCYFQKVFALPPGIGIRRARLIASIDNEGEIFVNGLRLAETGAWETATFLRDVAALRPGRNLLAVRATNGTNAANPAGVLAKLVVELEDGRVVELASDATWRSTDRVQGAQWTSQVETSWPLVAVLAEWGGEPWGTTPQIPPVKALPIFRKRFTVDESVRRALVHVCGLGHYELSLNGRKVGDRFLDPAWSVYEKTVYYTTYDFTLQLEDGDNVFGVMLGKGFYNTEGDRRVHGVYARRPLKLILQARIEYADGTNDEILSDGSWQVTGGPITHCAILAGSDYDARRLPPGWNERGFDDAGWASAEVTAGPGGRLKASPAPPMKAFERFSPARIDEPEPGVFVYDFGQNASATPRLRVRGGAGRTIRLTPAEQRHGQTDRSNNGTGRVNQAGVGRPNYWEYTLRGGGEEEWMPQFTYSGYQYLELTGGVPQGSPNPEGLPVVAELTSVHVRNASPAAGSFECSNRLFNDIDRLIDWAVRSNLAHVLTDCPHREKLGWLEVSYLMEAAIARGYDVAPLYAKITGDIRDSQDPNGAIYTVAPNYPAFSDGFRYTPEWGVAGVVLPWRLFRRYGDRRVLEQNYTAMRGFVDFMRDTSQDLVAAPGLGDWYDYGHGQPMGASRFTPTDLTATAIFYHGARIVAQTAGVLGNEGDRARYSQLAEEIRQRFNTTWFDGTDTYENNGSPQTANAMALTLGLVPEGREEAVLGRVVADLRARDNQQTAGDVGFHFLVEALARHGRSDVLFDIANRRVEGSYGFILDRGWTSMPEAWNANTGVSMNHCMLGHIQQWFFQDVLGIQADPAAPGFRKIVIRPAVVGDLTWVRGHYDSPRGRIAVHWQRDADLLRTSVTVPANTTATVYLPSRDPNRVTESGRPIPEADGVTLLRREGHRSVLAVESGSFAFSSTIPSAPDPT